MHAFLTGVVSTMHVQVCTLDRCCEHQRTPMLTRSLQDVHMCACKCSLFYSVLGNKDGRVQLVYESTCCLAWGVIFDRVLSVSFLFLTRMGVYVGVCVCIRTHTHWQMGNSVVSPGVGMRHLKSRKNPDRLKRSIHVDCIGVQSTFVYIYAGLRVLMIWANCLFFL